MWSGMQRAYIALGGIMVAGAAASAQTPMPMGTPISDAQVSEMLGRAMEARRERVAGETIRARPIAVTVDGAARTATLVLRNESDDTLTATLSAGVTPPPTILDSTGAPSIDLVLTHDSSVMTHETPIAAGHSLASWITGLPKSVTLAPRSNDTITVHVVPPKGAASGEYAAWILVRTDFASRLAPMSTQTLTLQPGKGMNLSNLGAKASPSTGGGGTAGMTTGTAPAGRRQSPGWSTKQLDTIATQLESGSKITYHVP